MKKLLLSLTITAFAIAAQATDTKTTTPTKDATATGACCSGMGCCHQQAKTKSDTAGACCSAEKTVAKGHVTKSQVLMSPKVAAEVASR